MTSTGWAVVTGGTKGIGLATAERFAADGRPVLLTYRRDTEAAEIATKRIVARGGTVEVVRCDLSDGAQPVIAAVGSRRVDALIVNAAASAFKPLTELKPHHIEKTLGLTVESMIELVNGLQGGLGQGSSIVTLSGGDSIRHIPGHGLLGAAKAALEALTRYYASELAHRGIRANCVLPGPVDTDSARIWASDTYTRFVQRVSQATPARRMAKPEDIANVIVALCGQDLQWVNGQVIIADGGMFFNDRIFADV
jgi:enoyl-[acyl-carrier protein] reductase III